ncbi:ABC transporter ATP-binding protein [Halopelagius longus]|uniref:ABC transporter ATP-binding protein n=1 Tax=Halopelagius longus TaxID=1236180 RepID=A0A1H1G0B4_9EURY|nr:ABC transporter ATP-binding protein [Halopelagius longus]RDI69918.1 ABC transporter ATP-binding protein [Halopelagius longus]SDR06654.1 putative ABC transport system ATP-binding protein [Halopelagius longus]
MTRDTSVSDDAEQANEGRERTPRSRGDSDDVIIRGERVVKEYQTGNQIVRALKGIDFSIGPSDFVAIVGPSGSGKSTLLNLLGLLDVPTGGTVRLRGTDVSTLSDGDRTSKRKQTIGFVFQSFYLIPTLTALENVEMPRMLDRTPVATRERATDLLRRVGLGDRLDHYPDELSGGQKQRVAIARSLINDPAILLADEPTGNLDRDTGDRILALFDELRAEEDVAVVTVTHDAYVAEEADRVVNLVDGEVQNATEGGRVENEQ